MSTFVQLQDKIMGRLNLTSSDARTRVKAEINERYRSMLSSTGLARTRLTVAGSFNTVAGTYVTSLSVAKVLNLVYTSLGRVLQELTLDQIRLLDPDSTRTGAPEAYAITGANATTTSVYVWPKPDAIYAIQYDALTNITDLSADGDVPVFPADFHDALVFGVLSDELLKLEKLELARSAEEKFDERVRGLRYFVRKSAYLHEQQGSEAVSAGVWPFYGPNGWLP